MINLLKILIYYPFLNILIFFIWLVPGHNAAWGIILLTIFVRILLLIPSQRATQAQRRIMEMQPLLDEIKAEYGDDKQGLAVAQMELYKKNNINPFSSCLLSLVQLPFMYVLFFAITRGLTLDNPNLYSFTPRPEFINMVFLWFDLSKPDKLFILPVIAAALQFVQMWMMRPKPPKDPNVVEDPAMAMQRNMLYMFPLFTLFIAYKLPSGTALYWVVGTLFTIGQQYVVNKEKLKLTGVKEVIDKVDSQTGHKSHSNSDVQRLTDGAAVIELPASGSRNGLGVEGGVKRVVEQKKVKGGVNVIVRRK